MLLAIEQGNTNTLFAVHDGKDWIAQWRTATESTRTADEYAVWLAQLLAMSGMSLGALTACIISSVVPQSLFNLRNLSRRYLKVEPLVIGENADLQIPVRIDKPSEAGADRLVNAIGAHIVYPGPLIVIDSGTATTFDVIGADGGFEGGVIAPGINLSMQALHEAAAVGDYATARDWQDRLIGLHKGLFLDNSPAPTKYALARLGLCTEEIRLPLARTSDAVKPAIDRAMDEAGVA
jgi:type III pantothenate kinase